ncbi:hypothetical protein CNEO4_1260087 [Clostridium neonatale]|uniref:Uncharacterized protein n=1 Tax=Clostridium neonatale TaxID=137838 RepID=A0AA86JGN4_9CLOT|nr:hypothetical protein CNEO_1240053 [Clostridium neonatale]CAG9707742.1 hypothetical protein CNEO_43194 [Clostridium neonatale]CAI3197928.1 hypothetical protein CNEO2_170045 [Clostridium neonatale]CAI3199679.1 hypothetical protein CNEO2_290008 [Clostridium neonatale]CAI3247131.1 hypothetical protein CNEO2_590009 [Clostridium neonatale]
MHFLSLKSPIYKYRNKIYNDKFIWRVLWDIILKQNQMLKYM